MVNSDLSIHPLYLKTKFSLYLKKGSLLLLLFLLAADFAFMELHALKSLGYLQNSEFSVTKSFGYAETFQYLKAGFIAACFLLIASHYKRPLFYCWGAVFLYILVDDSLEMHEQLGFKLSDFITRNIDIGLGNTAGELVVFALFGLLLFVPLGWYFYKSQSKNLKIVSQDLFILFIALLFFGIGVDVFHDFAETGTVINGLFGLIEDGGEMIVMSLIVWYTWTFLKQDPYFHQRTEKHISRAKESFSPKNRIAYSSPAERKKIRPNRKVHEKR